MDDQHLAAVVEGTIMELAQGANFLVECPTCGFQWAMAVHPMQYAALRNAYGGRAVESRFERLAHDVPAVQCGGCVFRGLEVGTC